MLKHPGLVSLPFPLPTFLSVFFAARKGPVDNFCIVIPFVSAADTMSATDTSKSPEIKICPLGYREKAIKPFENRGLVDFNLGDKYVPKWPLTIRCYGLDDKFRPMPKSDFRFCCTI